MTTAVFDTLKASRDLEAAGIEAKQAEAIVTTVAGAFEDTVATKADIVAVRADIDKLETSTRAELAEVKAELKTEIAAVRADLKTEIAAVRADIDKLETSTRAELAEVKAELKTEIAGVKADLKIIKYFFGPAIILLLLKIAFFS